MEEWMQIQFFPEYEMSNLGTIRTVGSHKVLKKYDGPRGEYVNLKTRVIPKIMVRVKFIEDTLTNLKIE
jgi:hypothetical protein